MNTTEKLLKAFEQFRPHINGHKTAIDLFFEGIKEVEDLQEQVKKLTIPDCVSWRSEQCEHEPLHSATETVDYCPKCGLYQPSK